MRACFIALTLLLAACGPNGPVLELIDAGRGPKRLLRYNVEPGKTHEVVMRMTMAMGPMRTPEIKMTMTITVNSVTPEGDIHYSYRFIGAEVAGGGELPGMEALQGLSGTGIVTSRGVTKAGTVNVPKGAPDNMKQMMANLEESMKQFSCPLPEQPVGVGAKWRLRMPIETVAFGFDQKALFELACADDETGLLKVTIVQNARNQSIEANGVEAQLKELKSRGTGEMEYDLTRTVSMSIDTK
ncbi:MAG: hypothetical protein ACYTGN_04520 [Planctomycetota bacterium]|jgi:hypothetical protein